MDAEGWFKTGDVASIDPLGFMRITDRSKDVIKSGGEWISSIDIENAAMSHHHVSHSSIPSQKENASTSSTCHNAHCCGSAFGYAQWLMGCKHATLMYLSIRVMS